MAPIEPAAAKRRTARSLAALVGVALIVPLIVAGGGASAVAAAGPNGLIAYSSWDDDLNYDIYVSTRPTPTSPPSASRPTGGTTPTPTGRPDGTKIAFDGWAHVRRTHGSRSWMPTPRPTTPPW